MPSPSGSAWCSIGIAGLGLLGNSRFPALGWIGLYSPALIVVYLVSMRVIFTHERQRRARETQEVAEELHYAAIRCERPPCST